MPIDLPGFKSLEGLSPPQTPTLDDIFMQKIHEAIHGLLDDTSLGAAQLCEATNLSDSQLYRKLKALTGLSPVRFIQKTRLREAKKLLETTALNVSEVAYQTGFSDPNYFSRAFSKEFGIPPSEIRK